ncbi:MAG: ABC transporter ATP-binding protein [Lachnospiraceae bacterium]|nr:ABC transporter ATP-binding protein [Lachnospiraceae bacterium]
MKEIWQKLMRLFDKRQKHQMAGLVLLMVIGAALETASTLLVMAVIGVVVTPDSVYDNKILSAVYNALGISSTGFSILLMVLLILSFVAKNGYLFLLWKVTYAFVYKNQFRTSERLMRNYIKRDYEFYLFADTAVVQRSITSDVNNMYGLVQALLTLATELMVSFFLVALLFITAPFFCIVMSVLLVLVMFVITKVLKPVMERSGKENQDFYSGLFKHISQMVQGIKEVKVTGTEKYFVEEYKKCGNGYVNAVQRYTLYNNVPKLLIETISIAGMMTCLIVLLARGGDIGAEIPALGGIVAAAYRLLPSANKINNQLNAISYFKPFLMNVSDNLLEETDNKNVDMSFAEPAGEKLDIKKGISIKNITYKYPQTERYIFEDADMEIPIGSAVGVVGTSGAGKTTIVDILLGLLKPEKGGVYADGVNTADCYRGWIANVGYIPQMIYMLDGSIRKNVAFGVPDEKIDEKRIWEVLEEAHLADYIRKLPDGLDTEIDERGIRISGGQRQRIGIARALYNDPEVLILDEATSALDNDTEAAIMESINALHGKKTLVIIAHRLQTIEKCDMVYRVENGKINRER